MFTIVLFLMTTMIIDPSLEKSKVQQDISHYLPKSGELTEWKPVSAPQKFIGEDLYLLINGGAVIYYEYGFKQVITQEYVNKDGKSINLEIYEMINPSSAYGIYTFKTGEDGKEISVGTDALFVDYYLNFWKGNFLVTLIAVDSEKETIDGLMRIARIVDTKIENEAEKPIMLDLLLKENLKILSTKYLKGNVALSNNYKFDSGNIFGLKEGVIGDYSDFKIFIFKYNDEFECMKWFRNARNHLKNNPRFDDFTDYGDDLSLTDKQGKHIYIGQHQNYILICLRTGETDPRIIIEKLKEEIKKKQF